MRYVRVQVQLTPQQAAALRRRAHDRGVSVAALLREAADAIVCEPDDDRWRRALAVVGAFDSGTSNTSVDHDQVFADSILE